MMPSSMFRLPQPSPNFFWLLDTRIKKAYETIFDKNSKDYVYKVELAAKRRPLIEKTLKAVFCRACQ